MDLQLAKILLKKINTLSDSLSLDDGPIASIERDLMLSYIRQLYEACLDTPGGNGQAGRKTAGAGKSTGNHTNPELEIVPPAPEKISTPEPPKRKYTPPKIIEIPDSTPSPEPVRTYQPPTPAPQPKQTPSPAAPRPAVTASGSKDPKINALFQQNEARELSEKLSLQPLKDLTKGLSINDRLLYTNDLFDKDANLFNAALKKLNEMSGMDEARAFLEEQAAHHNWADGEKSDVARDFIKHVRRRFV